MEYDLESVCAITKRFEEAQAELGGVYDEAIKTARAYAPLLQEIETLKGVKRTYGWELKNFPSYENTFEVTHFSCEADRESNHCAVCATLYCGGGESEYVSISFPVNYIWEGLQAAREEIAQLKALAEEKRLRDEAEALQKKAEAKRDREKQDRLEYERLKKKFG